MAFQPVYTIGPQNSGYSVLTALICIIYYISRSVNFETIESLFMSATLCPVCQKTLSRGNQPWHFVCSSCSYEMSILKPSINQTASHQPLDETARESGLRTIRNINFKVLLSKIGTFTPLQGKLLDVGCAHGWFLELAQKQFKVMGIEPDQTIFNQASKLGLAVRMGYFPDVLDSVEKFDVIVFNDVIEHIPDIQAALQSCHHHLNAEGLLVLNLPDSRGIFYRLSKIFNSLGFSGFFNRMWQVGMPSPHVHYFKQQNLETLLTQQGFKISDSGRLETLSLTGLFTRLVYAQKKSNSLVTTILYCAICLVLPVLRILPADITYTIARRSNVSSG